MESYFANFGRVTCVNIMYDKSSGRHRGFAFVDFNDYDPVDKVLCKEILTRYVTIFYFSEKKLLKIDKIR